MMTLSPFSNEKQGKIACNCLHGTAVIDPVTDQCYCINDDINTSAGPRAATYPPIVKDPIIRHGPDGGVWAYMPMQGSVINTNPKATGTTPAGDGKILGLNPLVFFGIVAGGLWLMSQSGGNSKSKGGVV